MLLRVEFDLIIFLYLLCFVQNLNCLIELFMHKTRSKGQPEYQLQKDIGGYIRRTRKEFLRQREMANPNLNPRLFGDFYKQTYEGNRDVREIDAESYVIPPSLITLI